MCCCHSNYGKLLSLIGCPCHGLFSKRISLIGCPRRGPAGGKVDGKAAVLTGALGILLMFGWGCGVKVEQLPLLSAPYVTEVEFLKEVRNTNGKAKKKYFDQGRVTSPFYFFLEVKEIENDGVLKMVFYESSDKSQKQVVEKVFQFGKAGKYYEYILFFDRVEGLSPGNYRYAIFMKDRLIYEGQVTVSQPVGGAGSL